MSVISGNIRRLMKERKLSYEKLGRMIGTTAPAVSNWVHEVNDPSYYALCRMKKAFDVPWEVLLEGCEKDA